MTWYVLSCDCCDNEGAYVVDHTVGNTDMHEVVAEFETMGEADQYCEELRLLAGLE